MNKISLVTVGAYVPEEKLTNADLEKMVETTDEWITTRTGIKERRIARNITASELAVNAARDCLTRSNVHPELLISSTCSAEKRCPYQASIVAKRLNLSNLAAFDLNAACSGLIYGMAVAQSMMLTGSHKYTLVTAGEKMTMFTDYTDRNSCILFGDAGAALLLSSEEGHKILTTELGTNPAGSDLVVLGGLDEEYYFRQDGRQVFKFAVNKIGELIDLLFERTGIKKNDRFHIVPHQANQRIMEAVARAKEIPIDRFVINIDRYGNTSSASIGLALKEAIDQARFKEGDTLFLIGFGGGLSWAAAAIRW